MATRQALLIQVVVISVFFLFSTLCDEGTSWEGESSDNADGQRYSSRGEEEQLVCFRFCSDTMAGWRRAGGAWEMDGRLVGLSDPPRKTWIIGFPTSGRGGFRRFVWEAQLRSVLLAELFHRNTYKCYLSRSSSVPKGPLQFLFYRELSDRKCRANAKK